MQPTNTAKWTAVAHVPSKIQTVAWVFIFPKIRWSIRRAPRTACWCYLTGRITTFFPSTSTIASHRSEAARKLAAEASVSQSGMCNVATWMEVMFCFSTLARVRTLTPKQHSVSWDALQWQWSTQHWAQQLWNGAKMDAPASSDLLSFPYKCTAPKLYMVCTKTILNGKKA